MSDLAIQRWLDKTVCERGDVASALVLLGSTGNQGSASHWPADQARDEGLLTCTLICVPTSASPRT